MAKSRNHTNHNQSRKEHRNGIKRPKKKKFESTRGMERNYVQELKKARRYNLDQAQKKRREKYLNKKLATKEEKTTEPIAVKT